MKSALLTAVSIALSSMPAEDRERALRPIRSATPPPTPRRTTVKGSPEVAAWNAAVDLRKKEKRERKLTRKTR